MKRKITFLFAMLVSAMFISAQTTIFQEGFEGNVSSWKIISLDPDTNHWYIVTGSSNAHTDSAYASSKSWLNDGSPNGIPLKPNNYLISPAINLVGVKGTISLKWWIDNSSTYYPAEHYTVLCSHTDTAVASFTDSLFGETLAAGPWTERTVNISSYAGQTIYLAWVHRYCTDNDRLKLDDISVSSSASINESASNFNLFVSPNPATDKLFVNLSNDKSDVVIYNMVGGKVKELRNVSNLQILDVSDLSEGMYMISVIVNNNIASRKINIIR